MFRGALSVWFMVAVSLGVVTPAPGFAQRATFADSVEVAEVSFDGARAFDHDVLASTIVTAETRCNSLQPLCWLDIGTDRQFLDERALEADVVRLRVFYYRQGFRETEVAFDTTRQGDRVRITFRIAEGRPVRVAALDFAGADDMPSSVTRGLPLAVGQPLSLVEYETARDTVTSRLRNLGYALADVLASYTIPADSPYASRVHYELTSGRRARFGTIEVTGAERVSPDIVRGMLTFSSGDVYSTDALLTSQRNLFAQELFRHAEIQPVGSADTDTLIDVVVQVNEGPLHRVGFGLGVSTADYLNAEGRWTSRNFLGGARRLELRGRVSNVFANSFGQNLNLLFENPTDEIYRRLAGSVAADFSQPRFFDAMTTLGAGVYLERYSLPNVFVRTGGGGHVSFTRAFDPANSLTLGYRPELTKLETGGGDRIFCLGFLACDASDIEALRELHWLSPVVASWTLDRSNSIFEPSRGFAIRIDAEHAGSLTGSDFSYSRVLAAFTDYSTLTSDLVFATRVRFGWAGQLGAADTILGVHPQKRFFAGGPNSVRGFAYYRLGPKLLTVDAAEWLVRPAGNGNGGAGCTAQQVNAGTCDTRALADDSPELFEVRPTGGTVLFEGNVELRFPVVRDHVRAATFLDFGQVWVDRGSAGLGDLVWAPGVGVRYFSPIGPLRVDIGYNPLGAERLEVVTTDVEHCPPTGGECEAIESGRVYDHTTLRNTEQLRPLGSVEWGPRRSFLDRLQLHFSIGQAF